MKTPPSEIGPSGPRPIDPDFGPRPGLWRDILPWVVGGGALALGLVLWPWGAEDAPHAEAPLPHAAPAEPAAVTVNDGAIAPAPPPAAMLPAPVPSPAPAVPASQTPDTRPPPAWAQREWPKRTSAASPRGPGAAAPTPPAPRDAPAQTTPATSPPAPVQHAEAYSPPYRGPTSGDAQLRAIIERLERDVLNVDAGPVRAR